MGPQPPDRGADGADDACRPCRGTGSAISHLGGETSTVTCPWCDGSGRFIPDHDAQARQRDEAGAQAPPASGEGPEPG